MKLSRLDHFSGVSGPVVDYETELKKLNKKSKEVKRPPMSDQGGGEQFPSETLAAIYRFADYIDKFRKKQRNDEPEDLADDEPEVFSVKGALRPPEGAGAFVPAVEGHSLEQLSFKNQINKILRLKAIKAYQICIMQTAEGRKLEVSGFNRAV